jgi:general secretion pathway protein H
MKSQDGFTIAEMLVVLAIMALLALAVWPDLSSNRQSDIAEAETVILKALRLARAEAIGENHETLVEIDVNSLSVNSEKLPSHIALKVLYAGDAPRGGIAAFRFFPDGTSTGGEVAIKSASATRVIAVNWLTGGARPVASP